MSDNDGSAAAAGGIHKRAVCEYTFNIAVGVTGASEEGGGNVPIRTFLFPHT